MRHKGFLHKVFLIFIVLVMIAVGLLLYMLWEYQNIKTVDLALSRASDVMGGIKIVYASDFQYDLSYKDGWMQKDVFQKAIDRINAQGADLVLLGGDYVSYAVNAHEAAAYLKQIEAPLGVYGIFGNHDNLAKRELKSVLEGSIRFLENESAVVPYQGKTMGIYGVEDLWYGTPEIYLEELPQDTDYQILLTHQPDFFESMTEEEHTQFDLTLSGHVHAGQITLFGRCGVPPVVDHVTDYGEKYRYGEKHYFNSRIYSTSGLGGSVGGLPLRFFARPEIVVIQ